MKKAWAMLVAVMMMVNFACMAVFAADREEGIEFVDSGGRPLVVSQKDKDKSKYFTVTNTSPESEITTKNDCAFDTTYYFAIKEEQIPPGYASDTYFRKTISEKKNMKFLDGDPVLTTRVIDGTRYAVIKVKIKESGSTDEEEVRFTITLKARKDVSGIQDGDEYSARFRLFLSNDSDDSGDVDVDAGDNVVFKPVINDDNTITWGTEAYPVATLEFEASSDADDFYAKLSTKVNSRIYDRYGDPANAELFFRTFSGDNIDATSRGTLTLYNPWYDDNYRNAPDPRDVYIYRIRNGELEDITHLFKYVDEDDTPEGLDGWEVRTRVLDAYVISDKQLDEYYDDELPPVDGELPPDNDVTTAKPIAPGGNIQGVPSTGSYNLVPIALVVGVISLTTVGLTRKKKNK